MKNILITFLLLTTSLSMMTSHAGLYKGLDAEGNVSYSDKPFNNAEKFIAPAITVINATKLPVKQEAVTVQIKAEETKYTAFTITAPKEGQSIWNVPDLAVALQLKPGLDIANGHYIRLLMNGEPLVEKSQSLLLQIGRADRGEHTLQAEVRNKKGKILKRTKSITIYIKNTVIKQQKR